MLEFLISWDSIIVISSLFSRIKVDIELPIMIALQYVLSQRDTKKLINSGNLFYIERKELAVFEYVGNVIIIIK